MVTTAAATRISAPLVGTLEATWAAIVKRHPDVPAAVVIVASGTAGRKPAEARWGHFAALRWVRGAAEFPEVLVAGEGLARGAESVMTTLLHEAAHGLAHVRKIKDTSRQGRYHNRRYRTLAEELGLDVAEAGAGWSSTTLRDTTIKQYRREIHQLRSVLTLYRRVELTAADGAKAKSTNLLPCSCACPRRIRVARATLEAGPIVCGICDEEFTVVQAGLGAT